MLTGAQMLSFGIAALALVVVPGPSVLFVISQGVAHGRRVALATVLGNAGGLVVHVTMVALGLGAVVSRSAAIFTVMKLAGAGYLVLLGVRALRSDVSVLDATLGATRRPGLRRSARDGFVVGVSNPKTTVFFLAVLPQFVERSRGHVSVQLALLGALFGAIALVSDSVYAVIAGGARDWLERRPERARHLGRASGVVLLALAARLALVGRTD